MNINTTRYYDTDLGGGTTEEFAHVKAIQDESGHWYVVPFGIFLDFLIDVENEEMADSGEFDKKYSQYRTGGDLNNIKLFIKTKKS